MVTTVIALPHPAAEAAEAASSVSDASTEAARLRLGGRSLKLVCCGAVTSDMVFSFRQVIVRLTRS